jgi:hypothetical protein
LKDPEALSQAKSSSWVEPERFSEDFNGDAGGFEECFVVSAAIQSKDFGLKFALGQGGCKDCELAFSSGLVECWDNECDSSQLMELRQQVTAGWGPARRFFTGAMLLTATQKGKVRASGRMTGWGKCFRSIGMFESQISPRLDHRKNSCNLIEILRTSAFSLAFTHSCPGLFPFKGDQQ